VKPVKAGQNLHYIHFVRQTEHSVLSLDRPIKFQQVETPLISRQATHEGGKAVSFMHRPPLAPFKIPVAHFC
jgi:hypothetical protein